MILKTCTRCGKYYPYNGHTICDECKEAYEIERQEREAQSRRNNNRRYNAKRNPEHMKFYRSKEWRTLSAWYAQSKGWRCEECGGTATDVHHVIPIESKEGWERRLDPTNLKMLCVSCHNGVHGRFKSRSKKR